MYINVHIYVILSNREVFNSQWLNLTFKRFATFATFATITKNPSLVLCLHTFLNIHYLPVIDNYLHLFPYQLINEISPIQTRIQKTGKKIIELFNPSVALSLSRLIIAFPRLSV